MRYFALAPEEPVAPSVTTDPIPAQDDHSTAFNEARRFAEFFEQTKSSLAHERRQLVLTKQRCREWCERALMLQEERRANFFVEQDVARLALEHELAEKRTTATQEVQKLRSDMITHIETMREKFKGWIFRTLRTFEEQRCMVRAENETWAQLECQKLSDQRAELDALLLEATAQTALASQEAAMQRAQLSEAVTNETHRTEVLKLGLLEELQREAITVERTTAWSDIFERHLYARHYCMIAELAEDHSRRAAQLQSLICSLTEKLQSLEISVLEQKEALTAERALAERQSEENTRAMQEQRAEELRCELQERDKRRKEWLAECEIWSQRLHHSRKQSSELQDQIVLERREWELEKQRRQDQEDAARERRERMDLIRQIATESCKESDLARTAQLEELNRTLRQEFQRQLSEASRQIADLRIQISFLTTFAEFQLVAGSVIGEEAVEWAALEQSESSSRPFHGSKWRQQKMQQLLSREESRRIQLIALERDLRGELAVQQKESRRAVDAALRDRPQRYARRPTALQRIRSQLPPFEEHRGTQKPHLFEPNDPINIDREEWKVLCTQQLIGILHSTYSSPSPGPARPRPASSLL